MLITKLTWPTWSSMVAAPSSPEDYNEAAVDRLMKKIDKHVIRVKGVRPQFEALNRVEKIYFKTEEEKKYYDETEKRYFEEKAQLEADLESGKEVNGALLHLVLLMKRCMAAERCRVPHIVERLLKWDAEGFAAVAAVKYKQTIIECIREMVTKHGISRDQISIIWGGGQTALTQKQKAKASLKAKAAQLREAGIDEAELMADLELDKVEDRVIEELPPEWRLGTQNKDERQREIDRFQAGRTRFCFFTFKAGGVGLSLHHSDEFSKYKVKRKPNGYAVESDIVNCPIRARKVVVAPTYSAIELVQGLGRCPRLTSLSSTEQVLLFYGGTVEDDVAIIVSQKLRCLSRVVRMRESWQDVVVGGVSAKAHLEDESTLKQDDPDELLGSDEEEE